MPGSPSDHYSVQRFRGAVLLDALFPLPSAQASLFTLAGGLDGGLWFNNGASNSPWHPINEQSPFDPTFWDMASFSLPPALSLNAGDTQVTARPFAVRMPWRRALTISSIIAHVHAAGATLTASRNYAWLCTGAGVYIPNTVTADQSTNWASTGAKVMAMTASVQVPADPLGYIYGVLLATGTTLPVFRAMNPGAGAINVNRVAGSQPMISFRDPATATGPQNITPLSASVVTLNQTYMAVA